MWGSLSQRGDDPDRVCVLVEEDELPVRLLPHDEPVLRREARLPEPDLLLPGRLLAVPHGRPPLHFSGACGRVKASGESCLRYKGSRFGVAGTIPEALKANLLLLCFGL